MEFKDFKFDAEQLDSSGSFSGYGSVFGNVDSCGDIVAPGAFAKSIEKATPIMLWHHNPAEPIGVWNQASEDGYGLKVTGTLLKDEVQRAAEAYALLKAKAITGLSIGYLPCEYSIDAKTGVRTLHEVDLLEISLVTFPANKKATVSDVKAEIKTIREFEAALRDVMGFSKDEARRIASCGFNKGRDALENSGEMKAIMHGLDELIKIFRR